MIDLSTRPLALTAVTLAIVAVSACATKNLKIAQDSATFQDANIDYLFSVYVRPDDKSDTGCSIAVRPDGKTVQVKRGKQVGWFVFNTCDNEQAVKLEFRHLGTTPKEILREQQMSGALYRGKIKSRFGNCHEDAPCGAYKYDIWVGKHHLDPEFEIIR